MIIELLLVPSSDPLEAVAGVCLDLPGQPQPPHHAELLLHRAAHRLALTPLHKLHNCTQDKISEVSDLSCNTLFTLFLHLRRFRGCPLRRGRGGAATPTDWLPVPGPVLGLARAALTDVVTSVRLRLLLPGEQSAESVLANNLASSQLTSARTL